MRFSYATVFLGFVSTALAQSNFTSDFEPIKKPTTGDTLVAGESFTIEWDYEAAYYPGHANLLLQQGDDFASLKTIGGIAGDIETDATKYKWDLSHSIPSGDNYYIKIVYLKDKSIYNYSSKFAIKNKQESSGGNSTTTATDGRSTATATSPSTISTTTSGMSASDTGSPSSPSGTASSSTQTGGSVATAGPAPFAFIGAAAVGMWAL